MKHFRFVAPPHGFRLRLGLEFSTAEGLPVRRRMIVFRWTQSYLTENARLRAIRYYEGKKLNGHVRYTLVEPVT